MIWVRISEGNIGCGVNFYCWAVLYQIFIRSYYKHYKIQTQVMAKDKNQGQKKSQKQIASSSIPSQHKVGEKEQVISSSSKLPHPNKGAIRAVFFANTVIATLISFGILHMVCQKTYTPIFLAKNAAHGAIIQSFLIFISCILIVHGIFADWLHLIGKTNNDIYRTHTNVIANTILWSVIFWGFILYDKEAIIKTKLEVIIVDLFLLSRLIFSVGYVLGAAIGHQSFRAVGFGLTLTCVVLVMCQVLGFSIIEYFADSSKNLGGNDTYINL